MEKYCIYRHIRLDTNKIFYIGIGSLKRPYNKISRNIYWKRITNKTNYEIQILKSDLSLEDAIELEKILINYYGRSNNKTGILCNLTDGGEGVFGMVVSKETKLKISNTLKGRKPLIESRNKMSISHIGNKLSKETKEKISNIMKFKHGIGRSKIVLDLETGIFYNSAIEASNAKCINLHTLRYKLSGKYKNNTNLKYI